MPVPEYTDASTWHLAVEHAVARFEYSVALSRHSVSTDTVRRLAELESSAADADGQSALTPDELAALAGVPEGDVLLIRAGLCSSGLMAILGRDPLRIQLHLPRGFSQFAQPTGCDG